MGIRRGQDTGCQVSERHVQPSPGVKNGEWERSGPAQRCPWCTGGGDGVSRDIEESFGWLHRHCVQLGGSLLDWGGGDWVDWDLKQRHNRHRSSRSHCSGWGNGDTGNGRSGGQGHHWGGAGGGGGARGAGDKTGVGNFRMTVEWGNALEVERSLKDARKSGHVLGWSLGWTEIGEVGVGSTPMSWRLWPGPWEAPGLGDGVGGSRDAHLTHSGIHGSLQLGDGDTWWSLR